MRVLALSCFLILDSCFLAFPASSFAQTPTTSFVAPNVDKNVPRDQHAWVQTVLIDVLSAASCQVSGIDPSHPGQPCLGSNSVTGKIGLSPNNGGLLGMVTKGIAFTFTPAAHTADYVHYLSSNFGLTKNAYAADDYCLAPTGAGVGTGFCSLQPLLSLWTFARNLAYLGFIIIFILIGFAIMLRVKINANTVVSIQYAIPKIIIALILITFSYAIAGFMIDMMYVTIGVSVELAATVDPKPNSGGCPTTSVDAPSSATFYDNEPLPCVLGNIRGDNPINFMMQLIGFDAANAPSQALGNTAGDLITGMGTGGQILILAINAIMAGAVVSILGPLTFTPVGALVAGGTVVAGILGGVAAPGQEAAIAGQVIAFFIIICAIFITMLRVWVILLRAYISLLVDIVFGPIWILFSVAPKSKFTFFSWMRSMLANLSVFPVVIGIFLVAKVFIDLFTTQTSTNGTTTNLFAPPLIGVNSLPLSGGQNPLAGIIGLGFILMAPTALTLTRGIFKSPQTSFLQNTAQGLGMGANFAGNMWGQTAGKFIGHDKSGNPRFFSAKMAQVRKTRAEQAWTDIPKWENSSNPLLRTKARLYKLQQGMSNAVNYSKNTEAFNRAYDNSLTLTIQRTPVGTAVTPSAIIANMQGYLHRQLTPQEQQLAIKRLSRSNLLNPQQPNANSANPAQHP